MAMGHGNIPPHFFDAVTHTEAEAAALEFKVNASRATAAAFARI